MSDWRNVAMQVVSEVLEKTKGQSDSDVRDKRGRRMKELWEIVKKEGAANE